MSTAAAGLRLAAAAGRWLTRRSARGGGVVLGYHDVVRDGATPATELDVTVAQLRAQVDQLRRAGFAIVPLPDLVRAVLAGDDTSGLAALTFDDGLAGVVRHAVPLLAELDAPATVFAVTAGWGRRPVWWPDAGELMTRDELRQVHRAGWLVAAHTRTHPSLPTLSPARLRDELAGCRADLEDLLGTAVDLLAYPYGHHDPSVRAATADAGYVAACTFRNGRVAADADPLRVPRLTMGRHHSRARLAYHLARTPGSWPDPELDAIPTVPTVPTVAPVPADVGPADATSEQVAS